MSNMTTAPELDLSLLPNEAETDAEFGVLPLAKRAPRPAPIVSIDSDFAELLGLLSDDGE